MLETGAIEILRYLNLFAMVVEPVETTYASGALKKLQYHSLPDHKGLLPHQSFQLP